MANLLDDLNPPQREAVLHTEGPLLVLAGAGSGKTRVLTYRIAHLIHDRGVAPWSILAITFTNKAAAEMRERIAALVGPSARDIWASTFHSACARILRREAEAAGYRPDFAIYDADDQLRLLRACFADEEVDPKRVAPRHVLGRISDAKNRLVDAEAFVEEADGFGDEVIARLYRRYSARLQAAGAMDFDDLLMVATRLLESDAEVRERYQSRFRYILVDEYQDTNHAQYRLVRVLAEPQRNICAVGDDDQSIYSWRGADVRNILDFERDYPDAHVVALEQNYRSTGHDPAGRQRRRRAQPGPPPEGAVDRPGRRRAVAGPVVPRRARRGAHRAGGDRARPRRGHVARSDRRLLPDQRAEPLDRGPTRARPRRLHGGRRTAVLRARRGPRRAGVPARGGEPGRRDRRRAPVGRAQARAGAGLPGQAEPVGPDARVRHRGRHGPCRSHRRPHPGPARRRWPAPRRSSTELAAAEAAGMPLSGLVALVLERSGLRAALVAEGTLEAQGRIENLDELENVAAEYQASAAEPSLLGFLEEVALQSDADLVDQEHGQVTLMTVHNAKGLEFDIVLMTGVEEGIFPHMRADDPDSLEEERRLCYVGMTRARTRLMLTHAETRAIHGGREYRLPSRFLAEIPPEAVAARAGAPVREAFAGATQRTAQVPLEAGDTVLHATFGEGVVTGVESRGSLVRVRFSRDGTERRLMAGAAPMRKVG